MKNVIIGAGVFGMATAIELIQEGNDVLVIDSNKENIASKNALGRLDPVFKGSGSSINTENNSIKRPESQRILALKSFNLHKNYFDKYYKETSFEYEFKNIATLQILNDDDLKDLKNNEEEIASYGFKLEILNSNEEIVYYQPGISKEINMAALIHGTMFIEASSFLDSLKKRFKSLGGKFINGEVESIDEKNRCALSSDGLEVNYDNLIVCAGPWTNKLFKNINLETEIFPTKGEIIKVKTEGVKLNFHIHGSCSIVEKSDGLTWVAATHEENVFNSNKTKEAEKELIHKASEIIPDFAKYKILDHSACVRPSTKDGMPILREAINGANIFIASGGGGWGIMQCFYVGKKMKEIIYGK